MEAIKGRPKGKKNFGFCVGYLDSFFHIIEQSDFPASMRGSCDHLSNFEQSHVNVVISNDKSFNTIIVRDGTVQGWISAEGSPIREFLKKIEASLIGYNDINMLNGKYYSAVIGTSANRSGEGTITEWAKAKEFGEEKGITLIIRFDRDPRQKLGSFSIYKLRHDTLKTMRKGVMQKERKDDVNVRAYRVGLVQNILSDLNLDNGNMSLQQLYQAFLSVNKNGYVEKNLFYKFISKIEGETSLMKKKYFLSKSNKMKKYFLIKTNKMKKKYFLSKSNKIKKKDIEILFNAIDFNDDQILSFRDIAQFLDDAYIGETSSPLNDFQETFARSFRNLIRKKSRKIYNEVKPEEEMISIDLFIQAFQSFDLVDDMSLSKEELVTILNSEGITMNGNDFSLVDVELLFALINPDEYDSFKLDEIYRYLEGTSERDFTDNVEKYQ